MTARKKRGPYRKGADIPAKKENYRVTLDQQTVDTMRGLSEGNLSAGIRKAADIIRTIKEVNK